MPDGCFQATIWQTKAFCIKSLNIWKSIYSLQEEIFVQQGAKFVSFPVTKPVVTQGTTTYQIKDLDNIFALIPLSFLWVAFQSQAIS